MNKIDVASVRTFAVTGHSGSGKTTLVDALLYKLGVNDRLGQVDSGSSMADYTDQEKGRKITIESKPFNAVFKSGDKDVGIVFCDTPGYMDFFGQVIAASSVCDSSLIVVDATDGVQVGTSKSWRRANELEQPRAIVVTGLDRDNADFAGTLSKIQDVWGKKCVPVTLPLSDGKGVADVLDSKELPDDVAGQAEEIKNALVESAAETDDSLIEKYLGGEALSADEIATGLRQSVLNCQFVPVFAVAPMKDVGLTELLEGIVRLLPSPAERKMKDAEGNDIDPGADAPFVGFVWRIVTDPHVGQLTFVKVCGGTLKADSEVLNCSKGKKERVATLLVVNGKEQNQVDEATAGDIVTMTKLKHTDLNDVLCASGHKVDLKPLVFPNALVSYAVRAKSRGDEDKIGVAMQRVVSADPTIRVQNNRETREMILSGMGTVHIEVAVEQMKARSNVEVELSEPKIPYRETVTGKGEGHYKHKKQSGGHGQYAEVYLFVEPNQQGDEDEWFVNKIVGGAIPTNFIPAVQKGLVEGMTTGTVAGYPVHNVKLTVYDGTFHEVDSSEVAFKIASSRAFKEAMDKAKPVLLEPVVKVTITVPERFMGDVSGDISHKRGSILGVSLEEGMQVITAEAPQAELSHYCAELRSMTAGEGSFELEHARYDVVPGNIATKVVAAAEKAKEEE